MGIEEHVKLIIPQIKRGIPGIIYSTHDGLPKTFWKKGTRAYLRRLNRQNGLSSASGSSSASAGDTRDTGSILGPGRFPWRRA